MSITAMKQALEALEPYARRLVQQNNDCEIFQGDLKVDLAITVLNQAIEQLEKQEPVAWIEETPSGEWFLAYSFNPNAKTKPLYTTPQPQPQPQQAQEPYAFEASMYSSDRLKIDPVTGNVGIGTPQPQQENT